MLAVTRGSALRLSAEGRIVEEAWRKSGRIRREVVLGPFVIMPDHFHALVGIRKRDDPPSEPRGSVVRPRVGRTVGSLIAGFKAASTGGINRLHGTLGKRRWQRGYYDRIVRDRSAFDAFARYIDNNPRRWIADHGGVDR